MKVRFRITRKTAIMLMCFVCVTSFPLAGISGNEIKDTQTVQQQRQVIGVVKDVNGEPIIGASVVEKGTTNGTLTDLEGTFSLQVKSEATDSPLILVVSYIGYLSQEITVNSNKKIEIVLKEDNKLLNEVVVVGFGSQKKVNLTGSVGVIDGKELLERPVANAAQALQGLIPGLQVFQTNGSLESRPNVNIRGTATIGEGSSGSPLVLIDGMEGDLNTINPQDIKNISVLKDAAASSIYGSRAPFGVILITTKTGRSDGKVNVNYNNNFRFGTPINMNRMMNSLDFASWVEDSHQNGGGSYFGKGRLDRIKAYREARPVPGGKYGPIGKRIAADGTELYAVELNANGQWGGGYSTGVDDVEWYGILYKDWNFSQEHNVSVNGGSEKFNYYLSGAFYDLNGFLKLGEENLKRFNTTAKINSQVTSWLKMSYNMRFTREDFTRPSDLTDGLYGSIPQNAWPVVPVLDPNGYLFHTGSPLLNLIDRGKDNAQKDNIYQKIGFELEPIKNWVTNVNLGYRARSENRHWDRQMTYTHDKDSNPVVRTNDSFVHEEMTKDNYYNFEAYTAYNHSFVEKHNFRLMGGYQMEEYTEKKFGLQRNGITVPSKPEVDLTTGLGPDGKPITPSVNGGFNEWSVIGLFGRLNYDYMGKYLLEANIRRDGSSRFRRGNRWKAFPSVSLGWNIANESFFEPLSKNINLLKIRGSYGSLGNQNTNNWYLTYLTMSAGSQDGSWLQNGSKPNTATAPGLVSESLTWETVESYNIALDWALLNSRLSGSFDYYVRNTKNMVGNAPELPNILGTGVPKTNNTDLQTTGWELSIEWKDLLKNGLSYGARLMLSDSRTKITSYPNNPTLSRDTYIPGRYMGEIWGFETVGLAKTDEEMRAHLEQLDRNYEATHGVAPSTPLKGQDQFGSNWGAGDIMYKDLDGDGKITDGNKTLNNMGDVKVIGNNRPRYHFGLDLNAAWKGFDLRIFFQGILKRDYFQGSNYFFGVNGGNVWNAFGITAVDNYFRDENSWSVKEGYRDVNLNAYLPRPEYSGKNARTQTRYLQDASYVRLKNLQVGYTVPSNITQKIGIERFRVFFSGENLITFTKLARQFDPETIETQGGGAYPLSTTLSGGVSLTF